MIDKNINWRWVFLVPFACLLSAIIVGSFWAAVAGFVFYEKVKRWFKKYMKFIQI